MHKKPNQASEVPSDLEDILLAAMLLNSIAAGDDELVGEDLLCEAYERFSLPMIRH